MNRKAKGSAYKMKGYSYPGISPIKKNPTATKLEAEHGGTWTKGWTDPKTKIYHSNVFSNEAGLNPAEAKTDISRAGRVVGSKGETSVTIDTRGRTRDIEVEEATQKVKQG